MITLHPDQEAAMPELRDILRHNKAPRIILTAPCGWGKGTIFTFMMQGALNKGLRVLFFTKYRPLIFDMGRRCEKLGLDYGVIMGQDSRDPWKPLQIASIDTLHRRKSLQHFDLVLIDEAHFATAETWRAVMAKFPDVPIIGASATPITGTGGGLGDIFTHMVCGPDMPTLIDLNRLVPYVTYAPSAPDTSKVHIVNGEFKEDELSAVCDDADLIGDIVRTWQQRCAGMPTVGFAVDTKHANHCNEQFRGAGVNSIAVHTKNPQDEEAVWRRFDAGEIEMVWSVGKISYGWDHGIARAGIDACPTWSLRLFLQKAGRLSRPYPGKNRAVWLDHAGNTTRHGLPDDPRQWTLECKPKSAKDREKTVQTRTCSRCLGVFSARLDMCPYILPDGVPCATPYLTDARTLVHREGELQEVKRDLECSYCKRSWLAARFGESCDLCRHGFMRLKPRPYVVKKLSKNPKIAEIQRQAEALGKDGRWIYGQMKRLGELRARA